MYMQINTHYFCYVGEQEVNEITESVREVNRGLPQWKISRLPTHTYGETPTCGWWWEKKKRFVADDSQYVITIYSSIQNILIFFVKIYHMHVQVLVWTML